MPRETARHHRFPELDCIRARLPRETIASAERRAGALGVGAERVLIAHGVIDEDAYTVALARWLGWEFESFDRRRRADCPLDDARLLEAARTGLLPLWVDGDWQFVVAPRSVRQLLDVAKQTPRLRFRLTSTRRFNRFIANAAGVALGEHAAEALQRNWPDLSSRNRNPGHWMALLPCLAACIAGACLMLPGPSMALGQALLATCFLAWLGLRLFGCFLPQKSVPRLMVSDSDLPVYTVIVALYREAASVAGLVAALSNFDYPPEKLDIKLVIEPDDHDTAAALQQLHLAVPFEVVVAPQAAPRTKPKALNAALAFARGSFTVVYDAEDRPEPDQLRRALDVLLTTGQEIACVQARLTIDNTEDGWLARLFTAEYAAQFDLFLPGLARMGLPLPLGGSSNHFRTDILRTIGAWDSYNVTEDADLGMRLARFGYRTAMIDSTTYEEAPTHVTPWIKQRSRWFKGWMQTWVVHMRHPWRLLQDLGFKNFVAFQLLVGGNVLSALVHPFFAGVLIYQLVASHPLSGDGLARVLAIVSMVAFGAGYLVTVIVGLRGLIRRGLPSSALWLSLIAVHWFLLSSAAWRALYQLIADPHRWEKTEHGFARSSRLARKMRRSSTPANNDGITEPRRRAAA